MAPVTSVISAARDVHAARYPSVVYPSSISFSAGPTAPIWKKWSIRAMYSNPASSAVRATVASSRPSPSRPRGVLKSGICSPTFMVITSRAYSLTQTAAAPGRPAEGAAVTTRADLIIVGAGLAGSAAAWAASARGLDVVLLEAFGPGHRNGSSHGSARIFRRAYADPLYVRLTGSAEERWRRLEDQAGERLLTLTRGARLRAGGRARA